MKLYNYFRSSASYRVRIALNLKQLPYEHVAVHLTRDGGEQFLPAYLQHNPAGQVPMLEDGGNRITQSLAIIAYLDERYAERPLMPTDAVARAQVNQLALTIACDVHPLNNLRVLKYLTGTLAVSEEQKTQWIRYWIALGLTTLETELSRSPQRGRFCYGDSPTVADCVLVPHLFNATRFGVDLAVFPTLRGIEKCCGALDAFAQAHPSVQPDAE